MTKYRYPLREGLTAGTCRVRCRRGAGDLQDSRKKKAQEAARRAEGRQPAPLRQVDLLASQLRRWPDYSFILALQEPGAASPFPFLPLFFLRTRPSLHAMRCGCAMQT